MIFSLFFAAMIISLVSHSLLVSANEIDGLNSVEVNEIEESDSVETDEIEESDSIETNKIEGWPEGPEISAGSAVLMDADTGTILYGKNSYKKMYPASTTKLLTCLLAAENLNLEDTITFSEEAITSVPSDGSNIGMDIGETITVEQCLYGLMVGSGNECANALAEAVSGSIDEFVDLMNKRMEELGCINTHFVNANGLHDDDHYTCAYDLCLIAQAFFENEICLQVGNCSSYTFEATSTQPDTFTLTNKHEFITGTVSYNGIIGGKTGYTSQAGENLVTGCEQGTMTLICVVMKEEDPYQFEDTVTLFDYGFDEFVKTPAEELTVFPESDIDSFLSMGETLLGSSTQAMVLMDGSYVDLPVSLSAEDVSCVFAQDNTVLYIIGSEETVIGSAQLVSSDAAANDESAAGALSLSQSPGKNIWYRILSLYISEGLNGAVYVSVSSFLITIVAIYLILSILIYLNGNIKEAKQRVKMRHRRMRRSHMRKSDYYENHRYDRPDQYYTEESNYDQDLWQNITTKEEDFDLDHEEQNQDEEEK